MPTDNVQMETLDQKDCYPDRKIISTIKDATGKISKIDNSNFGIQYNGEYNVLLPCNLPVNMQKEGLEVKFDGEVKDVKPEEMWAGQPFVLTACKVAESGSE